MTWLESILINAKGFSKSESANNLNPTAIRLLSAAGLYVIYKVVRVYALCQFNIMVNLLNIV